MHTASITELKARLSEYLREIKRGGEVQVLERGVPIARLVGIDSADLATSDAAAQRRARLIASGVLRPGSGKLQPKPPIATTLDLSVALDQDRGDRI